MSEWLTITIRESGLSQRVRKASISVYGSDQGGAYVIKEGRMIQVRQTEAELRAALEGTD